MLMAMLDLFWALSNEEIPGVLSTVSSAPKLLCMVLLAWKLTLELFWPFHVLACHAFMMGWGWLPLAKFESIFPIFVYTARDFLVLWVSDLWGFSSFLTWSFSVSSWFWVLIWLRALMIFWCIIFRGLTVEDIGSFYIAGFLLGTLQFLLAPALCGLSFHGSLWWILKFGLFLNSFGFCCYFCWRLYWITLQILADDWWRAVGLILAPAAILVEGLLNYVADGLIGDGLLGYWSTFSFLSKFWLSFT